jgi:hypothetical protein
MPFKKFANLRKVGKRRAFVVTVKYLVSSQLVIHAFLISREHSLQQMKQMGNHGRNHHVMGSGPLHPDQRYPTGNHSSGCFSRN